MTFGVTLILSFPCMTKIYNYFNMSDAQNLYKFNPLTAENERVRSDV
jgi:uncharacterized membrane protein